MLDVEEAVWQRLLLPKLALADLQRLSQASSQLRRLVRAAEPDVWSAATARQDLPTTRLSTMTSYQSVAQMAAQYAAVKTGASTTASAGSAGHFVLALHPNFTETLERRPGPVWLHTDACNVSQPLPGLGQEALQSSMYLLDDAPDSCGSPDGQQFVAYFVDWPAEAEFKKRQKQGAEDPIGFLLWAGDYKRQELRLFDHRSGVHVRIQLQLAYRVKDISWSPDSSAFALHCNADRRACEVFQAPAHLDESTGVSGWVPDCPGLLSSTWSPCSKYCAIVGDCALVLACPRDQVILAVVDEAHMCEHFAIFRRIGMSFASVEGHPHLVLWPEARHVSSLINSCESQPLVMEVTRAGPRVRTAPQDLQTLALELPLYQVAVGHGLAGIRGDGEVVLYQLRTGLRTPVHRTSCSVGSGPAALAWAPDGYTWLAVAFLDIKLGGATAVLEVINGRSGKSVGRQVIAEGRFHRRDHLSITWSSSGNALVVCRDTSEASEDGSEEGSEEASWQKSICRFWT